MLKDTIKEGEPQPKRPKGRPRADGKPTQPRPTVPPPNHHTTAEPLKTKSNLSRGILPVTTYYCRLKLIRDQ